MLEDIGSEVQHIRVQVLAVSSTCPPHCSLQAYEGVHRLMSRIDAIPAHIAFVQNIIVKSIGKRGLKTIHKFVSPSRLKQSNFSLNRDILSSDKTTRITGMQSVATAELNIICSCSCTCVLSHSERKCSHPSSCASSGNCWWCRSRCTCDCDRLFVSTPLQAMVRPAHAPNTSSACESNML